MNLSQIMTRHPICVQATDSVREALRRMLQNEIRHLPVLDKGELVGIVSDKDLRGYLLAVGDGLEDLDAAKKRLETRVSEIMQADPSTLAPEDNVTEAIDLMLEERVGAVLTIDPHTGSLQGIVSYVDVLRAAAPLFES
jgi:CBS domain-containing protein